MVIDLGFHRCTYANTTPYAEAGQNWPRGNMKSLRIFTGSFVCFTSESICRNIAAVRSRSFKDGYQSEIIYGVHVSYDGVSAEKTTIQMTAREHCDKGDRSG